MTIISLEVSLRISNPTVVPFAAYDYTGHVRIGNQTVHRSSNPKNPDVETPKMRSPDLSLLTHQNLVDNSLQVALRATAGHHLRHPAQRDEQQGRHRPYAEHRSEFLFPVDIDLIKIDPVLILVIGRQLVEHRGQCLARTAPGREKSITAGRSPRNFHSPFDFSISATLVVNSCLFSCFTVSIVLLV